MRRKYCLILLGIESAQQEYDDTVVGKLRESFVVLADYLLQCNERTSDEVGGDRMRITDRKSSDSVLSLLCDRSQEFLAVVKSPQLQELHAETKWMPFSTGKELFTEVKEDLKKMCKTIDKVDSPMDECNADMATIVHRLADDVQGEGVSLVNVYWILSSRHQSKLRDNLLLLGALKRLQEWSLAHISFIMCYDNSELSVNPWRQWLSFDELHTSDIPRVMRSPFDTVWHGALTLLGPQSKSPVRIPGFALLQDNHSHINKLSTDFHINLNDTDDRVLEDKMGNDSRYLSTEIQILKAIDKNTIPLFMLLPIKLKLYQTGLSERSTDFMNLLNDLSTQGLDLTGCISIGSNSLPTEGDYSTNAWINCIKNGRSLHRHFVQDAVEKRLCLISCDDGGQPAIFLFRKPDVFNGLIQGQLSDLDTKTQKLIDFSSGESLCIPDLTEDLLKAERQLENMQADNGIQHIGEKVTFGQEIMKTDTVSKSRERYPVMEVCVGLSSVGKANSDGVCISPEEWPERLWLIRNDPVELAAREERKKPTIPIEQVLSLDMKETLKMFRPDGRPVRDDLSPIKPQVDKRIVNLTRINTTEDAIRETSYPEALEKQFHGVEYCLDCNDSLSRDIELASTQISVVREETLSSCVGSSSIRLDPSRRAKRGGVSAIKKISHRPANKAQSNSTKTRSTKRVSPAEKPPSQSMKRKRKELPTCQDIKIDDSEKSLSISAKETRSQRHKRRLRQVVEQTLETHGINRQHAIFASCTDRLYVLTKSFIKDLKSSHGLNDEMKRLARCNVEQVIEFERIRMRTRSGK